MGSNKYYNEIEDLATKARYFITEDEVNSVISEQIDWSAFGSLGISKKEIGLMVDYNSQNAEGRADLMDERGSQYASAFSKCLETIRSDKPVRFILAAMDELLQAKAYRAEVFNKAAHRPHAVLKRWILSDTQDSFIMAKASRVFARLLSAIHDEGSDGDGDDAWRAEVAEDVTHFLGWVNVNLNDANAPNIGWALAALKEYLRNAGSQRVFADKGGLYSLLALMGHTDNEQLLYQVNFCVWQLSFNGELTAALQQHDVVKKLVVIVKTVMREKVVRLCCNSLRNLLDKGDCNGEMVTLGLPKTVGILLLRKWKDEDILEPLQLLDMRLKEVIQDLSSFEMYKAELTHGHLAWTPVHSAQFWRENHQKFEEGNFRLIGKLIDLLKPESGAPSTVCEVACYDLGEFARYHPIGKVMISRLRGKVQLMIHMQSLDDNVARQALLAVQKIMVTNWENLQGGNLASLKASD